MKYLAWIPGDYVGGCEDYAFRIIEFAASQGWDAECAVCNDNLRRKSLELLPARSIHLLQPGFGIEFSGPSSIREYIRLRALKHRYRATLRKIRPDVVHAILPWHYHSIYFLEACVSLGIPVLATYQLVAPNRPPHWRQVRKMQRLVRKGLISISAISNNNRQLLSEYYMINSSIISVIPNRPRSLPNVSSGSGELEPDISVRSSLLTELKLPMDSIISLTVASLCYQKGIDTLLHGARQLLEQFPKIIFCIAGDGPDRSDLEELSGKLDLTKNVFFLGQRCDIERLLAAADFFLFPTRYEGESFALLEAARSGIPIIASRASGIPETFREGTDALLFSVESHMEMTEKVTELLLNPSIATFITTNAMAHVTRFNEHDMLKETISLLKKTASNRSQLRFSRIANIGPSIL